MYQKALELTKTLVAIPSINATKGERAIGEFLYEYLRKITYFQDHPEQVLAVPIKNDSLGRMNVFALLLGEKDNTGDTIILHGHTDTVGVEDFGALSKLAFDCDALMAALKEIAPTLSEDVRGDLFSGDYLFGRGTSDMKGGDAVHLTVLEALCERVGELCGNILVSFNPVEESLHTGIIEGLDTIMSLREQYGLNYLFAINNDFICGLYPGDETRYIYTGSVGKLLPCFYVRGKETHVGQVFEGFDPCRVSGELVRTLSMNSAYCDGYKGEYPAPPAVLRMKELKPYYSVQTPFSSFVYFNYMVHNKNVSEVLDEMKQVARTAMDTVELEINEKYQAYCALLGIAPQPIRHETQVLEYRELFALAEKVYDGSLSKLVEKLAVDSAASGDDKRDTALKIVERLGDLAGIKIPTVVVFFATPHCPHNTLKSEVPEEKALTDKVQWILDTVSAETGEAFKIMCFFPSLTDSSYLKIDDDEASISALESNFPAQGLLYPVPYEKIRSLNIPGLNYGTFGKDAHKWTERVKMSYSFGTLPKLIIRTVEHFLIK